MGTETAAGGGNIIGEIKQPATGTAGADSASTSRTETRRTTADSGSGAGTGTAGTAGNKTASSEKAAGVVDVTEAEKAEQRRIQKAESAKRAQARKEAIEKGEPIPEWAQKRSSGTTGTRTRTAAAPKKQEKALDAASIQNLIKTVFDLVAARPNAAHWKLTDTECKQLAEPIADILSDYAAASEAIAQNSKYIALVMAAFAICAPRIMLSLTMKKARKEVEHGITAKPKAPTRTAPAPDESRKAGSGSAGSAANPAADGQNHVPDLYELVSTI